MQEKDGYFMLKKDHAYYYHIQMKESGTSYGDFALWREGELLIERIQYNVTFFMEALESNKYFNAHAR